MVQNKLKSIEDTICWINQEEALFKFPQSSYPDVGDVNTIQSGEGKMKVSKYSKNCYIVNRYLVSK